MKPMPVRKKISPEMMKVNSPTATDADLEELKNSSDSQVASIAAERLQARRKSAGLE